MAATVSLELDPIFLKGLGYLHSKSRDSAEKLKALLDESLARGSDYSYRTSPKEVESTKVSSTKVSLSKQDPKPKPPSSLSISGSNNGKSSGFEKNKKESEKRPSEKVKVDPGDGVEPTKKPRLEKQESRSSPITVSTSKDLSLPYLSSFDETSADDFAMEMGLACVVCRQMTVTSGNQLVECQECHNLYHQDCHKPQVTDKEVNDPRLVWYCARCTRQMKRMAQKTQKPPQKASPVAVSAAPVVKDTLVKKPEIKPKQDTASTFQAFKRAEVKSSAAASSSPSGSSSSLQSSSGLTGWAAFGAKTSSTASKLGPVVSQKPTGLSGLATAKPGLGGKTVVGGNGNGNGSSGSPSQVLARPPPPLTLGKPGLIRSSSNEGNSKVGTPSPSGSAQASSNQAGAGGGNGGPGGNGNGNNSSSVSGTSKASAEALAGSKTHTSQESQLNAMKRLQMVKKKAAQKKLKN